ncbi:MAG: hypothetical protein M0020_01610 [Actinomycetota bacterium]|nr:hypothetical protein [Actinomycetota bacterium]
MARLFIAVWVPEAVRATVRAALAARRSAVRAADEEAAGDRVPPDGGLRWIPEEDWHVTLAFLGQVGDVHAAVEVLCGSALELPGPIEAAAGPATACFGRRVLHVPVTGLVALSQAVAAASWPPGAGAALDREPVPHITVARSGPSRSGPSRSGSAGPHAPRPGGGVRVFAGIPVAARWMVDAVALVSSETLLAGARYTEVASRSLR